jgi:mono/diheme cytochrome c family protein
MNKELNYILQGFLLMLLIIGAIAFVRLLLSARLDSTLASANASPPSERVIVLNSTGKALFQDNCSACHSVRGEVDGPSIFTIEQRIPDKRLLYDWIRNSSTVLKSGNKYFNSLVSKYGGVRMPDFPHLTDDDVTDILEYIRQVDTLRNKPSAIAMD